MDEQLPLAGVGEPEPVVGVSLTHRQGLALRFIVEHGPVTSDELGAMLHDERRSRGGRGHDADERCEWCAEEGSQMGATLRAKELVRFRRGERGGWYAPKLGEPHGPADERHDPSTAPLPEGF